MSPVATPRPAGTPTQLCERCGAAMRCGLTAGDAACWCASLPVVDGARLRRPDGGAWGACLCPACLGALATGTNDPDDAPNTRH